ncbi:unnamed protein product [Prorocentrum cordatum]|uniref:Uncharacterized protein n=1 Tax=Prorocentrum cordatum TaxID=2364126 RepID=A0ABN9PMX9_9DINO|nr:unnamed protein product [Polarella glacialis]
MPQGMSGQRLRQHPPRADLSHSLRGAILPEQRSSAHEHWYRATGPLDQKVLDEEERIYQELQGGDAGDQAARLLEKRQAESRERVRAALATLLKEDLLRIERWGSDVSAVLLAVDGLEGQLKQGSSRDGAARAPKKGKAAAGPPAGGSAARPLSSEQILEVSAQVVDDLDEIKRQVECAQKVQLSLEQTARGAHGGAAAVQAADLEDGLAEAAREVEWIREHSASWVERAQSARGLEPAVALLTRTQEAVRELLLNMPPGLLPPNVHECLSGSDAQMEQLCGELGAQARWAAQLQAESDAFGARALSLQDLHERHRARLGQWLSEELRRPAEALEEPLQRARDGLRQQGEDVAVLARGFPIHFLVGARVRAVPSEAVRRQAKVGGHDYYHESYFWCFHRTQGRAGLVRVVAGSLDITAIALYFPPPGPRSGTATWRRTVDVLLEWLSTVLDSAPERSTRVIFTDLSDSFAQDEMGCHFARVGPYAQTRMGYAARGF